MAINCSLPKGTKLVCIDNSGVETNLILGNVYELVRDFTFNKVMHTNPDVTLDAAFLPRVINDKGEPHSFKLKRFNVVSRDSIYKAYQTKLTSKVDEIKQLIKERDTILSSIK